MISAVTINQVRETLCKQYVLKQLTTQLQHLQKNYMMAEGLQKLYSKREFEVALNQRLFLCGHILFLAIQKDWRKINFA